MAEIKNGKQLVLHTLAILMLSILSLQEAQLSPWPLAPLLQYGSDTPPCLQAVIKISDFGYHSN